MREVIRRHARGRELSEEGLRRTRENYTKLTGTTAERILRFWQSRQVRSPRLPDPATSGAPGDSEVEFVPTVGAAVK